MDARNNQFELLTRELAHALAQESLVQGDDLRDICD